MNKQEKILKYLTKYPHAGNIQAATACGTAPSLVSLVKKRMRGETKKEDLAQLKRKKARILAKLKKLEKLRCELCIQLLGIEKALDSDIKWEDKWTTLKTTG